jgi:mannan endo-1,4-beta-mannosidase
VTETGVQGLKKPDGSLYDDYWTKGILTPIIGEKISMVVVWRNKYDPGHQGDEFYAPFKGQSSSSDFESFYKSPITIFGDNIPNMYKMADGIQVD